MALDVDTVLDRRRLARRVAVWRGLAILIALVAVAGVVATRDGVLTATHVARLPIKGAIVSDRPLVKLIERFAEDDDVAGVVVAIDSPGGTSVGGERLFEALRELDRKKPVVAHIGTLGASAAYMAALASDRIVAHRTSLTGSIGVLIQYGQISELLDRIGVKIAKVDSGPLKAEPNPFEPVEPEAVALLQSVVDDSFSYFLGLVMERRNLSEAEARRLADGRIFTGAQALAAGLIDALGDENAAVDWLESERGVAPDLPVRTYEAPGNSDLSLFARLAERAVDRLFGTLGLALPPTFPSGSVDGLWSVWQVSPPSDK